MLDRAPDCHPVSFRVDDEAVRLDREMCHHREGVGILYDYVGSRGIHITPAKKVRGVARVDDRRALYGIQPPRAGCAQVHDGNEFRSLRCV